MISKFFFDNMSNIILIMRTRVTQLETLFNNWDCMDNAT
jgi:hypothetical protein